MQTLEKEQEISRNKEENLLKNIEKNEFEHHNVINEYEACLEEKKCNIEDLINEIKRLEKNLWSLNDENACNFLNI